MKKKHIFVEPMMAFIHRYSAVILTLLFLFPQVQKNIFEFYHHKDAEAHCNDVTLHFCEKEHVCNLCDYQVSPYEPLGLSLEGDLSFESITAPVPSLVSDIYKTADGLYLLRAPPYSL